MRGHCVEAAGNHRFTYGNKALLRLVLIMEQGRPGRRIPGNSALGFSNAGTGRGARLAEIAQRHNGDVVSLRRAFGEILHHLMQLSDDLLRQIPHGVGHEEFFNGLVVQKLVFWHFGLRLHRPC